MKTDLPDTSHITAVRRFNRFYTRQIGVLRKTYLDSPYSLGEMRVLYELAQDGEKTATDIGRDLDLDAGYLSRVLRDFEKNGLLKRTPSKIDARQNYLSLTAKGRKVFAPADKRSQDDVGAMLSKLTGSQHAQLVSAMQTIEILLEGAHEGVHEGTLAPRATYTLRAPRYGDFGWMVSTNAKIYASEYGWGEPFEGLCAQIVADFANKNDPTCERCWIAERNGENVGAVMLVKDEKPDTARIRVLIVDPKARGLGVGAALTDACISFAREAGYKRITLWTHKVLTAARHVYKKAGFTLTSSEKRKSWGQDVVSEIWDKNLDSDL